MRSGKTIGFRFIVFGILVFVVLISTCLKFSYSHLSSPSSGCLVVTSEGEHIRTDFGSIQEAINEAENGSTVFVPSGVYYERIVVNKTISLIGENISTTIIDGNYGGTVVRITADNVTIAGFTVQNSGWGWTRNGIYVHFADYCTIRNNYLFLNCHNIRLNYSRNSQVLENIVDGDGYGVRLISSVNCTAIGNNVTNCIAGVHLQNATSCTVKRNNFYENDQGTRLYSPCAYNKISANNVQNNNYDGAIAWMPPNGTFLDNVFFHNNFINNTRSFIYDLTGNIWDCGYPSGGNYWSRYFEGNGIDLFSGPYQNRTGSDGIGDTSYSVNSYEVDRYPLMHPWSDLPVHNINTGIGYDSIQEAIDDSDTLKDHTLWVESGVYHEHVDIYKSLTFIGEDRSTTIIDGDGVGTVLSVNADNVSIVGFTIRDSGVIFPPYGNDCGVFLDHSSGSNISHNLMVNNRIGIFVYFSEANVLESNVVSFNDENGIWLWYSGSNVLTGNEILNNSYNFGVFGGWFSHFNNSVDSSNVVNGKPIKYMISVENETFDRETNMGVLYLINCVNVTVRDISLTRNGHGVFFFNVTNSIIENVTALRNNYGIYLQDSANNLVHDNYCPRNWVGICLQDSDFNVVQNNLASYCEKGVSFYEASNNDLVGNTVESNLFGIRCYSSHYNKIFHNNLIENNEQVSLLWSYSNVWDNGFEGNFWNDYQDSDVDKNGLGDVPRTIDGSNQDVYPLLGVFHLFNVQYNENSYDVEVISNSRIIDFAFDAANNVIRLTVNGTDETTGFCRISIPHDLIEPEILVVVDDGLTEVLYENYNLREDGFCRWIYFEYMHSTHEIMIVPEFLPAILLLTLVNITFCYVMIKRKIKIGEQE